MAEPLTEAALAERFRRALELRGCLAPSRRPAAPVAAPTAEAVAQNVLWKLRKFTGVGTKATDDVTMMVVRVE